MKKLAILGPIGTFTDEASQKLKKDYEIVYLESHKKVFESLKNNKYNYALIAIENQLSGTIIGNLARPTSLISTT